MVSNSVQKISHYLSPVFKGGGEVLLADLIKRQSLDKKNKIILILGAENEYMEKELQNYFVNIIKLRYLKSQFSYSKIETILRAIIQYIWLNLVLTFNHFDIFHSHSFPAQYLLIPKILNFFKIKKTKYIHTKHIDAKRKLFKSILWIIALKLNDNITFVSRSSRESAFRSFDSKKLKVIGNPVSEIFFDIGDERISNLNNITLNQFGNYKELKICVISRLVKGKGHLELINFISKFIQKNSQFSNITISILGDGPLREKIENEINLLNLNKIIFMFGLVEQQKVLDVIKNSDFAIHPSTNEGLSISCLQYLASCLPTFAKQYGPSFDVFEGNTLYYDNYDSFEECFLKFSSKKTLLNISYSFLGSRDKAKWSKIVQEYDSLYKS